MFKQTAACLCGGVSLRGDGGARAPNAVPSELEVLFALSQVKWEELRARL